MVALLPEGHKLAKRKTFSAKFAETEAYIVTCPGLDIDGIVPLTLAERNLVLDKNELYDNILT